ncbi:MAG TPA: sialidase family protein [Thermoanaerobaculia bacterium]
MTALRRYGIPIAIVIAALPAIVRSVHLTQAPQFAAPLVHPRVLDGRPQYSAEFLPATSTHVVHGSSIAELADGDLLAVWYGGSDETRTDVAIYASRCDHRTGRWTDPQVIETPDSAERALRTRVKSVGNPVVFAAGPRVSLFYTAILFGGWSAGTICLKDSTDGTTWSPARHVRTSPLFNIGMLVRGRPWLYADGSIALPIYQQLERRWSAIARVTAGGDVVDQVRIEDPRPLIQPWIVPTAPSSAVAFLRSASRMPSSVTVTKSDDGGMHWDPVFGTSLVQRDSAVAGARLADGSLLAIYNNTAWDRRDLSMARSPDGGIHWSKPFPIERDTSPDNIVRREYSYPYLIQANDGTYHLLYTWQRTRIRHIAFNDAWLLAQFQLRSFRG